MWAASGEIQDIRIVDSEIETVGLGERREVAQGVVVDKGGG